MNLFRALYISVFLFVYNDASDFQKIQIRGPNPQYASYVVKMFEPLEIVLEDFFEVLRCTYKDYTDFSSSYYNYIYKTSTFIIKIAHISPQMSSKWQCEIVDINNVHRNISFDIRIKGLNMVDMKVGRNYEVYSTTNLSVLEYDGIAHHEYEEGDIMDLACGNRYSSGQIRMKYYDVNGTIVFDAEDTGINYDLVFRMLIKDKSVNQSYVDCTYVAPISQQEFTYRTIFTVITNKGIKSSNDFIVTVNGMELTALPRKVHGRDKYIYHYTDGEPLKLTCAKKSQLILGDIYGQIKKNSLNVDTKDIMNTSSIYSTLIETAHLDGTIFQCYAESEQSNITVDIMFSKEHDHDPYIVGLPASNILYQYNTGNHEWRTLYQYRVQDKHVLNLTCITAINREPRWIYRKNITSVVHDNKKYRTKYINNAFNIDVKFKETIICESTRSGTVTQRMIIVLLNGDRMNEVAFTGITVFEGEMIGIITGISGALIIGVLVVCCWRLKRNNIEKDTYGGE